MQAFAGYRNQRDELIAMGIEIFEYRPDARSQVEARGRELVVLCAKGGSSEMVVEVLREAGFSARNVEEGMVGYGDYLQAVRVPLAPDEAASFECKAP